MVRAATPNAVSVHHIFRTKSDEWFGSFYDLDDARAYIADEAPPGTYDIVRYILRTDGDYDHKLVKSIKKGG